MEDVIKSEIEDVNTEMRVVGCLFNDPDLLLDYGDLIVPKYDFYHDTARFLYVSIYELYQYHGNKINEAKINIYMNQDDTRKKKYKKIGGYQFIERLMKAIDDTSEFEKYYNDLKKYSLLRELERKGFPAKKIFEKNNFHKVTPQQILDGMEYQIHTIGTKIGGVEESIRLGADLPSVYEEWKKTPDFGVEIPFPIINMLIRGWRKRKLNLLGLHSGTGKSRITSKIAIHVGIKLKKPLLIMVNEQDKDEWDAMLLSGVINNPEYGFNDYKDSVKIDETKIVTGTCSPEEDEICKRAAQWIADNTQIYWVMLNRYDHNTLKREIKRHKLRGCDYFIYDTLKSPDLDWQSFVKTGDMLKNTCNEFDMGGWATFQLTDDSLFSEVLTSQAIASGKHIKHIADGLFMARPLFDYEYDEYEILYPADEFNDERIEKLDETKKYYIWFMDKNRGGRDKDRICIRVDKGRNLWQEEGYLVTSEEKREYLRLKKEEKRLKTKKEVMKLKKQLS